MVAFTVLQLANGILVLIFLFIGFKFLETNWSYRISKPHAWEAAVKAGSISKKLKRIERFYRDKVRFYAFWLQIERLKKENVEGSFAELGVYQGETAKMIHAMDPSRKFHLFDTFTGFDNQDTAIDNAAKENAVDFTDTSLEMVLTTIGSGENIVPHKGFFPATTNDLAPEKFSLVHLDADLYPPTLAGLKYFYPRLSPGGILIIHDYNHNWEGVAKAVDEFVKTIPEQLNQIPDWQGSVMIVKNRE